MTDVRDYPGADRPKTVPCAHCGEPIYRSETLGWTHLDGTDQCELFAEPKREEADVEE